MGRYVPPEHEGVLSGNQLHKKRPPGQHGSTLTVRFEMPFNIVCCHCEGHIAQGVRFNAEKTKVGNYYSTPIWAFKMKHTVCSGVIVIRTDPKNTAYLVAEGGRKQHEMAESEPGAVIKVRGDEEGEGVMEKLEKQSKEKRRVKEAAPRIEELWRLRERQWADPYEHSKKMRKIFRVCYSLSLLILSLIPFLYFFPIILFFDRRVQRPPWVGICTLYRKKENVSFLVYIHTLLAPNLLCNGVGPRLQKNY